MNTLRLTSLLIALLLLVSPVYAGKISGRTAATTPLTGAETIGVIQGGADRKTTLDTITASVKGYGALCDGVTDDTASFTAAIAAMPTGSVLTLPPNAVCVISSITINKRITIRGTGAYTQIQANFGDGQWAAANQFGSIIKSTATSGAAITIAQVTGTYTFNSVYLEGFMLLGPGSGTSVGILTTTNTGWSHWQDVLVANFSTGVSLVSNFESQFDSLRIRGCTTGLALSNAANQNVFINTEFQSVGTALTITESADNLFSGGLAQSGITTFAALTAGASAITGITFDGWHFESAAMVLATFDTTAATIANVNFRNTYYTSTGGFTFTGPNYRVNWLSLIGNQWANVPLVLTSQCCQYAYIAGNRFASFKNLGEDGNVFINNPLFSANHVNVQGISGATSVAAYNLRGTKTFATAATALVQLGTSVGVTTFTNATDTVNRVAHGLENGERVHFVNSGGALPTNILATSVYYVVQKAADTFKISATLGGGAFDFTSDGTGTNTVYTGGEITNTYFVTLSGSANETFFVTSKNKTNFTVNSSNASSTATVNWMLME